MHLKKLFFRKRFTLLLCPKKDNVYRLTYCFSKDMFIMASYTLSFPSLIRYNAFQDIFILTPPLYSNKMSISNDIYTSTLLIKVPLFPITFQDSTVKTTVLCNIKREEQQLEKTSSSPL